MHYEARQGDGPPFQRSGPRADADAHARRVLTHPCRAPARHHGLSGVAVGVPFATARADDALSLSDVAVAGWPHRRSHVFMRAVGEDELALCARIEFVACSRRFAVSRSDGPAETRERALRAPSRDSACQEWPDSSAGLGLHFTPRPAPQPLRGRCVRCGQASLETGGECARPHPPLARPRTKRRQTARLGAGTRAPATMLVPARLGLRAGHSTNTRRLPPGMA